MWSLGLDPGVRKLGYALVQVYMPGEVANAGSPVHRALARGLVGRPRLVHFGTLDLGPGTDAGPPERLLRALYRALDRSPVSREKLPVGTIVSVECQPARVPRSSSSRVATNLQVSHYLAAYYHDHEPKYILPRVKDSYELYPGAEVPKTYAERKKHARYNAAALFGVGSKLPFNADESDAIIYAWARAGFRPNWLARESTASATSLPP